ncbi:MAG: SMC-Scp complex subunit ScpB [Candidatus Helarchaeota archaeon]
MGFKDEVPENQRENVETEPSLKEDVSKNIGIEPDTASSERIEDSKEETVGKLTSDEKDKLVRQVEAALFLAGRPLGELELAEVFGTNRNMIRWALRRIKRYLEEQKSALEVLHLTKDRWVMQLCEEFSRGLYDYIKEFIPKEEMLSREEVDTLTEIAYRQPITSATLVKIIQRPNVYENIKSLNAKGLITVEKEANTNILRTSKKFADIYGFDTELRNLKIQLVWRLKKRAKFDH